MISPPAGSVSSRFSTVHFNSFPSLRLMTTTLILSATLLQPDIALQFTHGKHQRAFSRGQTRKKSLASHMPQGEPGGVKMAHCESVAGRFLGQRIQRATPDAPESVALRYVVQASPVGRPG